MINPIKVFRKQNYLRKREIIMQENLMEFTTIITKSNLSNNDVYRIINKFSDCLTDLSNFLKTEWASRLGDTINEQLYKNEKITKKEYDRRLLNSSRETTIRFDEVVKSCEYLNDICRKLDKTPVFTKEMLSNKELLYSSLESRNTDFHELQDELPKTIDEIIKNRPITHINTKGNISSSEPSR